MPVDYSKFRDVQDSDEEPLCEAADGQTYRGLSQKSLHALDKAAEDLRQRSRRCFCFLDLTVDPGELKEYASELQQLGAEMPPHRRLGRVILEIDQAVYAPKLCENARSLFTGERGFGVGGNKLHYKGRKVDLILPKTLLQISIPNEYSCWGTYLKDERLQLPGVSFSKPGLVAFGNHGRDTNSCTLMITLNEAGHLDGDNQIVGRVIRGMEVLRVVEMLPTDRKERSFAERNVRTWWGGKPMVNVVIEDCGELQEKEVDLSSPEDGDTFPEHPIDASCESEFATLFGAQERLRGIGNNYYRNKEYRKALEKYTKAQKYLQPLLREQHVESFPDEDVRTWMAGGHRPKDRTDVVRADLTIKLNLCQVLLALEEWQAAITVADGVLLELVGKHSRKGCGALPLDPLVVKALFRRARARVSLSTCSGEVSQLEEAIEDLKQALYVEPHNGEVQKELLRLYALQKEADAPGQVVYQGMWKGSTATLTADAV